MNPARRVSESGDYQPFDAELFGVPAPEIIIGLKRLDASPPLWPIEPKQWLAVVASVRAFAGRWDAWARAAGWTSLELYGLHLRAPYARLDAMGAAWLLARSGDIAHSVDAGAIVTGTHSGNRLRIYRTSPHPELALAWTLV